MQKHPHAKYVLSAQEMEDGVSDHSKYEPGVAPISYFPFFCKALWRAGYALLGLALLCFDIFFDMFD